MEIAKKWLGIIKENYKINDDIIESQTEYFLIVCRSIHDYVISDFLKIIDPKMKNIEKSEITRLKKKYFENNPKHIHRQKILKFLEEHNKIKLNFEKDLLVKYFVALRNWTVHSIFPNIYENQHGNKNEILTRRFQRNFVDYLGLEGGGHLLFNTGWSLKLNSSDEESIFDKYPLNELTQNEKSILIQKLENEDPINLMNEYISKITDLVKYFENNY